MRRGRSGIGTELVPLVLILASLAGSLALVIAIHRRYVARTTTPPPSVAVLAPPVLSPVKSKPIAVEPPRPEPEVEEPEPPPPPPPEDLTPKALAKLMAAEADQLLEASRADRKTAELEAARKASLLESEKWRRRESLVRLQLDSLETKVHKLETEADELALERDALEKEIDARKALAAQARSRPGTAILPHRGQNGTWRRPIVVECVNGMAILRPQNAGFGLLDLAMGFGPATNPFVATVAREAIRIQGNASPDGQRVTPYIFFLVRPDGIRTYYEARGRLEALGITFGYELADQDWEIDFPDLDDVRSWDGSSPVQAPDSFTRTAPSRPSGSSPAEFENLPDLGTMPGTGLAQAPGNDPKSEFTWPPRPRTVPTGGGGRVPLGGTIGGTGSGGIGPAGGGQKAAATATPVPPDKPGGNGTGANSKTYASTGGGVKFPGGTSGADTTDPKPGPGSGPDDLTTLTPPRELSLGGPIKPLQPISPGTPGSPQPASGSASGGVLPLTPSAGQGQGSPDVSSPSNPANQVFSPPQPPPAGYSLGNFSAAAGSKSSGSDGSVTGNPPAPPQGTASDPNDPANTYVFPSPSEYDASGTRSSGGGTSSPPPPLSTSPPLISPNQTPPIRHVGPFTKPLASGVDPALLANASSPPASANFPDEADPTQPDRVNSGANSGSTTSGKPNSGQQTGSTGTPPPRVIGPGDSSAAPQPSGSPPPPLAVGLGTPGSPPPPLSMGSPPPSMMPPPSTNPPQSSKPLPPLPPDLDNFKIIDRRYEIVVVCNARGVIVQPGAYRVTSDALKHREGLLKTQIVALVKARRTANPKVTVEPSLRFLVQPGGEATYWTARSQFLLSGLDWPMKTQVADRDHLTILPSESW